MTPLMTVTALQWLELACGYGTLIFVGALGFAILKGMWDGNIDLSKLISEPNGDASMSRFQFLIFTFVIALSLFLIIVGQPNPQFPPQIPPTVLALLGISGSSYLVSKSIQFSDPAGIYGPQKQLTVTPGKPIVHVGQTQQFNAEVLANPNAVIKWEIAMGYGTISSTGLYTADLTKGPAVPTLAAGAAPPAPVPPVHATVQATVEGDPDLYDLAVVTILA